MLSAFFFSLALATAPPEFEPAARAFVDAMERRDAGALMAGAINSVANTAVDIVELHENIDISSYRVLSVDQRPDITQLFVELEGTGVTLGLKRTVPLPRWWYVDVKPDGSGGWTIVRAMLLERKLAIDSLKLSDAERIRLLSEHPEINVERYLAQFTALAQDNGKCEMVLWALDESRARGLFEAEMSGLTALADYGGDTWNGPMILEAATNALQRAQQIQRPNLLSEAYFKYGIALWVSNRLPEGVEMLRKSASYIGQSDDPRTGLRALYMAGHLEMRMNNLRPGLALAEEFDRLVQQYPTLRGPLDASFHLSLLHGVLGNVEISRRKSAEGIGLARKLRDPGAEVMLLYNSAEVTSPQDEIRVVSDAVARARGTSAAHFIPTMRLTLADAQVEAGAYDDAEKNFAEVLEDVKDTHEPNVIASALRGRSRLRFMQKRFDEALADAHESRRLAQAEGVTGRTMMGLPLMYSLVEEGRALRALGRLDEATAAFLLCIDVVEAELAESGVDEEGSALVLIGKLAPYRELLALYASQNRAQDALVIAERMRARSLRGSLRYGRVDLSVGLDEAKRAEERELEAKLAQANRALLGESNAQKIAELQRQRDDARLALREFRTLLYVSHPDIGRRRADVLSQDETWTPSTAPHELAVELTVTDDEVLLFTVHGSSVALRRIPIDKTTLATQINDYVAALEQRDLLYRTRARSLYDLFLKPIAAELSKATTVRFVPDGALWKLPFHTLIDAKGRHLVETMNVSYSPSLALTDRRALDRAPARSLLAFANPLVTATTAGKTRSVARDASLGALPETVAEARAVAKLYSNANVRVGEDAQESAFKREASDYRVLHLAAHSIIDDGAPMFSSIVLNASSNDADDDGLLEAHEIADLKLHADLAVLSACETAGGKVTAGEGVVGLSWAFLSAGVPTTVVSQWKVSSTGTAMLMVDFHKHLRSGHAPAAALRDAMLELRRNPRYRHPFYWAPFVVIETVGEE